MIVFPSDAENKHANDSNSSIEAVEGNQLDDNHNYPKEIKGVGTFQDTRPLEKDPLISALSEAASMFPFVGKA
jgi:hypothetical protein